jgi:hypothetical protein
MDDLMSLMDKLQEKNDSIFEQAKSLLLDIRSPTEEQTQTD